MSFQSLQNKLSQLQKQAEEKSWILDQVREDRSRFLKEKEDSKYQLKLNKEEVDQRLLEIQELKNQFLQEKNNLMEHIDSELAKKKKEKTALEIEHDALREHISMLQEKEKTCQQLKDNANHLRTNLSRLKTGEKGLTKQNYKLFCQRKSDPYPREGTMEVKLAWVEEFNQFVANLNRL
ncbi:MAG: hypothetical protein K9L23_21750 [Desulfotignum sp.]|nr:hypothetical protein [Desulfotignum sp.]